MFFLLTFLTILSYSENISIRTENLSVLIYDKFFVIKTIEYFKDKYDINIDSNTLTEIFTLKKYGYSRTEIVFILKLSCENNIKISEILQELKKENDIFKIAKKKNDDINKSFKEALKTKDYIENTNTEIDNFEIISEIIKKEFYDKKEK